MRILTLTGTRPEIIRLSETIKSLDKHFEHRFVHSGQNIQPEMHRVFFEDLNLRAPDSQWNLPEGSLGRRIGESIVQLESEILAFRPDALLVLGDTNTALAALIAKRMGVTIYHVEAGNRSFDSNVPEEVNRKIIDHFSDFNLAYSTRAYSNLIAEGLHPRTLAICGSPMAEILDVHKDRIAGSQVLKRLGLKPEEYFVVSAHRQENIDLPSRRTLLLNSLQEVAKKFNKKVVISAHPRLIEKISQSNLQVDATFLIHPPFSFTEYVKLQMDSYCVLSDSGTISEESSILGFPAVTIRDSMERQEALDTGSIGMSGLGASNILRSVELARERMFYRESPDAYIKKNHAFKVTNFIDSTLERADHWFGRY